MSYVCDTNNRKALITKVSCDEMCLKMTLGFTEVLFIIFSILIKNCLDILLLVYLNYKCHYSTFWINSFRGNLLFHYSLPSGTPLPFPEKDSEVSLGLSWLNKGLILQLFVARWALNEVFDVFWPSWPVQGHVAMYFYTIFYLVTEFHLYINSWK